MVLFKVEGFKTKDEAEKRIKHLKENRVFYSIEKEPKEPRFNEFYNEWQVVYSFYL